MKGGVADGEKEEAEAEWAYYRCQDRIASVGVSREVSDEVG